MAVLPHELVDVFTEVLIMKYTVIAALTVLVWDYFVTLPDEVALIWPGRLSISKILFALNRYMVFADPVIFIYVLMVGGDAKFCETMLRTLSYLSTIGFIVAQCILMLRTYAVWGNRFNTTFVALFTVYLCLTAVSIWNIERYLAGVRSTGHPAPGISGCTFYFSNRWVWRSVVIVMGIESVLMILLAYKVVQQLRAGLGRSTPLMQVIFRDGLGYFACILVTSIANLFVILLAPVTMHLFLLGVQRAMHSILCNRIMLNIRGAYQIQPSQCCDSLTTIALSSNRSGRGVSSNGVAFNHSVLSDTETL
ncbi:hypothetical protein BD410DRAFT_634265 [Rickenella mellea]|uniref:DUF6533 domain-containing protein n=1 Tax=Rickenella mellea TaxID=50990 RepID=A0A4Y7QC58_9AGAM|nr:hypothetical protein BD410DRAFT_634265 [Rickenella mellea]